MRAALLALLLPSAAAAQALTWDEAAAEAARANPDLAASRLSLEASRAAYFGSFNGLLPRLNLTNSASETSASRSPSYSASASASLSLFDAGEIAGIRSASASARRAEAALRAASADLRAGLRRAFSDALFSERALEVAERIRKLRAHDAELVALRYGSGRESKGNSMRAQAQALQASAAVEQAERELAAARQELARRLGREKFETLTATGTLGASRAPEPLGDLDALLPLRTDVATAEAEYARSRAALASARSALFPSLSASYTRTRSGSTEFPGARYSWSAGATASLPLLSGGPTAAWYDIKAAKKSSEASQAQVAAARANAAADLRAAWSAFAGAVDQVRVQAALLAAARQRNDEADVRYASGLLSFDNWEVIVSDRVSSERAAVAALREAMDAETAWDRALGRALGE